MTSEPKPGAVAEGKKPSEFVNEVREEIARQVMATPGFHLLSGMGQAHASLTAVVHYLDEEHTRRSAFERDVLARLEKLEALCPRPSRVHDMTETGYCRLCGYRPKEKE